MTHSTADRSDAVSLALPFTASSASEARRRLQGWLVEHGCAPETVYDGRLLLTELVGNAVRHAQPLADGTLRIAWQSAGGDVEIQVTDGGAATVPHQVSATSSAVNGRGLTIVDALASAWWTEASRSRSTVHALFPVG